MSHSVIPTYTNQTSFVQIQIQIQITKKSVRNSITEEREVGGEMAHLIFVWKQLQKDLYHTDKILVNIHTKAAVIHHQSNCC